MNCTKREDEILSFLIGDFNEEERKSFESHLGTCTKCKQKLENFKKSRSLLKQWNPSVPPSDHEKIKQKVIDNIKAQTLIEERISKELLLETIENEKGKAPDKFLKINKGARGGLVKNKRSLAVAMAAMIVIALILVINLYTRQNPESIAWAEMIENIEKIELYKFQLKTSLIGAYEEAVIEKAEIYHSSEYGILSNRFIPAMTSMISLPDDFTILEYASLSDNTFIRAYPEIKKYTRFILPEKNVYLVQEFDLVAYLKMLSTFNHRKLDSKIIDGKEVVGFEILDPKFGKQWSDITMAQIWIDMDTTLPVLYEFVCTGIDKLNMSRVVLDKFEWYETDEEGIFEFDFSEYQLVAEIEVGPINEETMILTLQKFSEVSNGRYPRGLASPAALWELKQIYKKRTGGKPFYWEEEDFEWEDYAFLHSHFQATGRFYGDLFLEYEEVAYHGKVVTTNDPGLPLLRWKISDNEYRVLFGDLRIENVSAEDLADLETYLDTDDVIE